MRLILLLSLCLKLAQAVRFLAPAALSALSFLDLLLPCGQRAWLYCFAAASPENMGGGFINLYVGHNLRNLEIDTG